MMIMVGRKACVRYEIKFDLSNSSLSSGPPSLVELRSSGGAGEYRGPRAAAAASSVGAEKHVEKPGEIF